MKTDTVVRKPSFVTRWAWRAIFALSLVALVAFLLQHLEPTAIGQAEAVPSGESCLPGQGMPQLQYPHISQKAASSVVYNSNPPTSGPHFAAAVAPGIYRSYLVPGLTIHSLEHGRIVIHYRPDLSEEVVGQIESVAKRYARSVVVTPDPKIDVPIALAAWGRLDLLDGFDEARITTFIEKLRFRFDHEYTERATGCGAAL